MTPRDSILNGEEWTRFGIWRSQRVGYYEVPADVVEDVNHLKTWMKRAIDVALSVIKALAAPIMPTGPGATASGP